MAKGPRRPPGAFQQKLKVFFRRLWLVVWKNLYLRRNQYCVTTFEIIFPIIPFILMLGMFAAFGGGSVESILGDRRGPKLDLTFPRTTNLLEEDWCDDFGSSTSPTRDNLVAFTPSTDETKRVMEALETVICPDASKKIQIVGTPNETLLEEKFAAEWKENLKFHGAIVFTDGLAVLRGGKASGKVPYKIRIHAPDQFPSTGKLMPTRSGLDEDFTLVGPNKDNKRKYLDSGFLQLQLSLDMALAKVLTTKSFDHSVSLQPFPYPYVEEEEAFHFLPHLFPLMPYFVYAFGLCFMIPAITRNVVGEKQTGISELLRMSGVSGVVQWLGWFIHVLLVQLITISLLVCLMKPTGILVHSDGFLYWLVLLFYMSSSAAVFFFICAFFQKPTIATTVAELFLIITMSAGIPIQLAANKFSLAAKLGLALIPNFALAILYQNVGYLECAVTDDSDQPVGLSWRMLATPVHVGAHQCRFYQPFPNANYEHPEYAASNLDMILMLMADTVLYILLAIYFDCVLPSEYGVKRPWYLFNFKSSKGKHFARVAQAPPPPAVESGDQTAPVQLSMPVTGFEPEPLGAPVGVDVQNIVKKFGRQKVAVNGVSLRMYVGDIFALLGHNGAGKTTLISMLTGFFSPTSGTAFVGGFDVRYDLDKARESLGVCPQHNMLFDNLTVFQQMRFFGMLRGLSRTQSRNEADMLMMQMHFFDKSRTLARKLSGGQKRKLSLGMALIGGTRVVILDEPTSGMDPQARREIWDILLQLRQQRTILLTTHFMEEADVLGDRIGIMANGVVQCCGTSDYLKKFYGTGYTLKLTLHSGSENEENEEASMKSNPRAGGVLSAVQKHVPTATFKTGRLLTDHGKNEVFISLPGESTSTELLSQMFADLIPRKEKLGVKTIGLSESSMDEVFIKVGEKAEEEEGGPVKVDEDMFISRARKQTKFQFVGQFRSLLIKKYLYSTRKWVVLAFEIAVPLLLFLFIMKIAHSVGVELARPDFYRGPEGASLYPRGRARDFQEGRGSSSYMEARSWSPLKISLSEYEGPVTLYSDQKGELPYLKSVKGHQSVKASKEDSYDDGSRQYDEDYRDQYGGGSRYPSGGGSRNPNVKPMVYLSAVSKSLVAAAKEDVVTFKRNYIVAVEVTPNNVNALFNLYPYHAAPLAINVVSNALLRSLSKKEYELVVTNHPFDTRGSPPAASSRSFLDRKKLTPRQQFVESQGKSLCYALAFMGSLGLIFLAANFVVNPIEEKLSKAKQLQTMTGVNPTVYWGAAFLFDYCHYFVVVVIMIGFLINFDYELGYGVMSRGYAIPVLLLIMMAYGFCGITFSYLISFRSTSITGGFTLVTILHIIMGMFMGYSVQDQDGELYILQLPALCGFWDFLRWACRPFPTFSLFRALWYFSLIAARNSDCPLATPPRKNCPEAEPFLVWSTQEDKSYSTLEGGTKFTTLDFPGIGQEVFFMFLMGFFFLGWIMLLDFKIFRLIGSRLCKDDGHAFVPSIHDEDVAAEADRVNMLVSSKQIGTECLLVQSLSKSYGAFAAVNRLHFGVHHGECFGLLGINGAGKTTAFRMITGDEMASLGTAFGFGTSLDLNPKRFYSNIGYCPQFDAILPLFTGKQMLQLFAGLRGIPFSDRGKEAMKWLVRMGLADSANVRCGKYSGGMKRRLSTAMALIGDPQLILLDEPTSGVDPVSRRNFWKILEKIREGGQSIILTSHSMDECEALCSRLGIMVNGQFQCFGGVQHLKSKFAQGYSLSLKLKPDLEANSPEVIQGFVALSTRISEKFQPCELKDQHQTLVQYHLKDPTITWDVLFRNLEELKAEFPMLIDDYTVNETSLEEVFLAFAQIQTAERKANVSLCKQICTCSC